MQDFDEDMTLMEGVDLGLADIDIDLDDRDYESSMNQISVDFSPLTQDDVTDGTGGVEDEHEVDDFGGEGGDSDDAAAQDDPFPWSRVIVVIMITVAEGFSGSVLLPFVVYMCLNFGYTHENVNIPASLVTAAFFAAQFLASFLAGRLSDRFGRRPLLLVGSYANSVCALAFGFSWSLPFAIAMRALNGLFNSSVGVVKSYLRESTSARHQAMAYSLRSAGYMTGYVLGPFFGGLLSRPTVQWPNVFPPGGFLQQFPFLLPCVISALLNLATAILSTIYLKESRRPSGASGSPQIEMSLVGAAHAEEEEEDLEQNEASAGDLGDVTSSSSRCCGGKRWIAISLMKEKGMLVCLILYASIGFVHIVFAETFSFWATKPDIGLNFLEKHLGITQAAAGGFSLLTQSLLYPRMDKRFGTRNVFIGASLLLMLIGAVPFLHEVVGTLWLLWTLNLTLACLIKSVLSGAYASVNLMVSNLSPVDQVGASNGLGASFAAGSRLVAPVVGGGILTGTAAFGHFPLDYHFVFLMCAVLSLAIALCARFLLEADQVNRRRTTVLGYVG